VQTDATTTATLLFLMNNLTENPKDGNLKELLVTGRRKGTGGAVFKG
jgi:hypothetical protein